jgi:hypothetical protein
MFDLSARAQEIRERLLAFMREVVEPGEREYHAHVAAEGQRWTIPPVMEEMKRRAKAAGLWNLFLPDSRHGAGLTNLDYARLAEIMGRSLIASEVFNCSAPDTGNMEVLHLYGNEFQKKQWLEPLLAGEIRSGFAMTEPDVASSDATNIRCRILREGDHYRISGRKWWTTGAMDPRASGGRPSRAPLLAAVCRQEKRRRGSGALHRSRGRGLLEGARPGRRCWPRCAAGRAAPRKRRPPGAARPRASGGRPSRAPLLAGVPERAPARPGRRPAPACAAAARPRRRGRACTRRAW